MADNTIRYAEGTETVVQVSIDIDNLADEFFTEYNALYLLVENELGTVWRGEDYEAFKQKVNAEKHYFDSMRDVMNEYATFLRNTANANQGRMDDSKSQVETGCDFE